MKPAVQRLLTCILMLTCGGAAAATTYYVKPSGNDGLDGKSQANAWKTCNRVNTSSFVAGDSILFERGGEWREQLLPNSSGMLGNPITYADYGSGAKPKIWGSDVLDNASFTSAGSNTYTYNIPGLPGGPIFVLQNGAFLGTGPATYDGTTSTLTITSSTDPGKDGKLYTVCTRGNIIYSNYKSHLVFRNLVVDETAGNNADGNTQGYGVRIQGSIDVLVENCEALHCWRHNMAAINAHQIIFKGCHAAYVAPTADNSLYVSYADAGAPAPACDSTYDTCSADNQGSSLFFVCHDDGSNHTLGAITFKNTTSHNKISVLGGPTSFTMLGGTLLDGRLECFFDNIFVDGVTFQSNAFVDQYGSGGTFQNCLFENISGQESGCFILRNNAANNIIRFNTIVAGGGECLAFYGSAPGTQWYGNIFQGAITSGGTATDMIYVDYNFYPANATILGNSLATWKGLGKDTNSLSGDPLFTNAANHDFTLQAVSTALNAANVAANLVPLMDFSGITRPQGAGPEMGAFEKSATGNVLPTCSITIPTANQVFQANADITITATAGDTDGTVTMVEFYQGATKLGNGTNGVNGWSYTWNGVAAGSYSLTAKATDNSLGSKVSAAMSIKVNAPPTVSISVPADSAVVTAGSNILITALAGDTDGTVSKVEFFEGANKLGEDTNGADGWSYIWTGVAAGSYSLTAKATDSNNGTKVSAAVAIKVNALPTVSISAPADGTIITAGSNLLITALADDTDGTVNKVEFFEGANKLGEDTNGTDGWSYTWNAVTVGNYSLTAQATDNNLGVKVSAPVAITVGNSPPQPPVVNISAPAGGMHFAPGSNIAITANATDPDDDVAKVEFFEGVNKIGAGINTSGNDWTFTWSTSAPGIYSLIAVATDASLLSTASTAISITVDAPPAVSINAPVGGTRFAPGSSIAITANATDPDDDIAKVEFFKGATKIGEGINTSGNDWSFTWSTTTPGNYSLIAVATDASFLSTASAAISITVQSNPPNPPPAISAITTDAGQALTGNSITFTAMTNAAAGFTYLWDFGDGETETGNPATHMYAFVDNFTVKVTVSDGHGNSATSTLAETVALGGSGTAMTLKKLSGSVLFGQAGKDRLSASGILPNLPQGFNPANLPVTVYIGGVTTTFTLNAKGSGTSHTPVGTFALKLKRGKTGIVAGPGQFRLALQGTFAGFWALKGIDFSVPQKRADFKLSVNVVMAGVTFAASSISRLTVVPLSKASFK